MWKGERVSPKVSYVFDSDFKLSVYIVHIQVGDFKEGKQMEFRPHYLALAFPPGPLLLWILSS